MKQTLLRWAAAAAGLTAAVLFSSCAYDPYYSDGYGYSGGSYSSSVFISTGDSRWGYDPYCHSYYDYNRRAYYDPFLYSYYPVGYRPPVVYGVPHPHGWRPGSHYCPPPSRVRNTTLSNYRDRESLYRRSNFSWANQARQQGSGSNFQPRADFGRPRQDAGNRSPRDGNRFNNDSRPVQRQFPGYDSNRGRSDRDDSRGRPDFTRPPQRNSGFDRPQAPDRSQFQGRPQMPDRSQFQNRPQIQDRSRENRRPSSPSGFNNPVRLAPERSAPRIDRTPQQRIEPRQQEIRPSPAPAREASRPGPSPRQNWGGGGGPSRERSR